MGNTPYIQFVDIHKQFGEHKVLTGVNLSIYKGEILAIIGKSGTGKSVLLKHLIGLIHQDKGSILIEGKDLRSLSSNQVKDFRKELSYMFQENALFDSMTIYDNIALPLVEKPRIEKAGIDFKVRQRIKQLGLEGSEDQYPSELSGGMRKRVALARALVTDPTLVLFDEPTTGLDPIRKHNVHSMISRYQEQFGFTAVVVSHDLPDILNIAQRVAMLDNGKILFEGTRKDVSLNQREILQKFVTGKEF